MLSTTERLQLPTREEFTACLEHTGSMCHGLCALVSIVDEMSKHERNKAVQHIDRVAGRCQAVQQTNRLDRKDLPCYELKETIQS